MHNIEFFKRLLSVPTHTYQEDKMIDFLSAGQIEINGKSAGQFVADKLKNTTGWKGSPGNNESGFTGLPGGVRNLNPDRCNFVGNNAYWWSSNSEEKRFYKI